MALFEIASFKDGYLRFCRLGQAKMNEVYGLVLMATFVLVTFAMSIETHRNGRTSAVKQGKQQDS